MKTSIFITHIYTHRHLYHSVILFIDFKPKILFDPLYDEFVTNNYELVDYLVRHILVEIILPLFFFIAVMLTFFVDWSWIPQSSIDRERGNNLEKVKKDLFR
tara:strand:- start:568 stop:873 length:306 start_codon:yes stop_codon:yes gene_type:complete